MPKLLRATRDYYDRKMRREVGKGEEFPMANDRAEGLVRAGVAEEVK